MPAAARHHDLRTGNALMSRAHRGGCDLVKLGRTAGSGAGSGEFTGDIEVLERPDHMELARAVQRAAHLGLGVKACAGMVTGSWGGTRSVTTLRSCDHR